MAHPGVSGPRLIPGRHSRGPHSPQRSPVRPAQAWVEPTAPSSPQQSRTRMAGLHKAIIVQNCANLADFQRQGRGRRPVSGRRGAEKGSVTRKGEGRGGGWQSARGQGKGESTSVEASSLVTDPSFCGQSEAPSSELLPAGIGSITTWDASSILTAHTCSGGLQGVPASDRVMGETEIESAVSRGGRTRKRVVTFPQFVVASERGSVHDLQGALFAGPTTGFRRARSLSEKSGRGRFIDPPGLSLVGEASAGERQNAARQELRRQVEARRSYRQPQSPPGPSPPVTAKSPSTPRNNTSSQQRSPSRPGTQGAASTRPGTQGGVPTRPGTQGTVAPKNGDLIVGLYPEAMADYLQARTLNTGSGSATSASSVGASTPVYHTKPPPPTPASALLRNLEEQYAHLQEAQEAEAVDRDPSVSNTTHKLLQSKLTKQTWAFPDLNPDEQRKALKLKRAQHTPPEQSPAHLNGAQTARPAASPPKVRGRLRRGAATERTASGKYLPSLLPSQLQQAAADVPATPRATGGMTLKPDLHGSRDSLLSETSKRTGSRDRFSRMRALGLPRVNIDAQHKLSRGGQRAAQEEAVVEGDGEDTQREDMWPTPADQHKPPEYLQHRNEAPLCNGHVAPGRQDTAGSVRRSAQPGSARSRGSCSYTTFQMAPPGGQENPASGTAGSAGSDSPRQASRHQQPQQDPISG